MAEEKLFDVSSEIIVLANILQTPSLIHQTNGLKFYMFSATPHATLFQEMEELREKNLVPDPELLVESLRSKNALDAVGGKKYIETIRAKEVKPETFKHFVELVVSSYKGRSFISILSGVDRNKINASNLDEAISTTRRALDGLVEMNGGSSTVHVSDIAASTYAEIIGRMDDPGIRGVSWGVSSIDNATGGKSPGDLVIIAGRPGAGKSSVICNSIMADAVEGKPALLISREMRPQELMERMISIDTGIPSTNIRLGVLSNDQVKAIYDSLARIKKYPIYIDFNFRLSDPYYLESTVHKFRNEKKIEVVYVDYIQILADRDENQTQEIGKITRLFKLMSNELNICSILCSQLNRKVEERDDKRPMLSDMRQSGAIEEDADFVIGLYRDEYYNPETKYKNMMEYIILKHRNGPPGTVTVKFDGPSYRISEA